MGFQVRVQQLVLARDMQAMLITGPPPAEQVVWAVKPWGTMTTTRPTKNLDRAQGEALTL